MMEHDNDKDDSNGLDWEEVPVEIHEEIQIEYDHNFMLITIYLSS